ncbi:MAG: endonuclease/exonuclease/phosphatase family protein [Leptotrichiaceae bacterium]|nr:endonuclease/exonuclease/phosphatase family protein [Leptotrichiaceae bacterium]MBP6281157.1 endonuclease/exonuclease/phosphatase family protein [Leptotrichiaceae bacterium]MBP7100865.1 endonuclease/exonuclease/phosphatase family protein [Leptotrichiaceae bacterium]MBP7739480.1 endonuclease/exonuclease/phosphatase family protein [Leptotrichiaceae bacterium]MBP9629797.1 endonuclease/exonuclease/phosphatase family protein [Leptotrichiaceae bacterium]
MKLLTINVHAWIEENQMEKIDILARTIAEKEYDVVAMQEVNQIMTSPVVYSDIREDNYGWVLLQKIAEYTDTVYYYHWSNSHIGYNKYDEGIGILTKHELKNTDDFYCTRSHTVRSISSRKIISAEIEYNGYDIEFYSCHMNLPTNKDEDIIGNIQTVLNRNSKDVIKVLMGDFNTDAISSREDYEKIISQGLLDTYKMAEEKDDGITVDKNIHGWENDKGKKRIDYIFINKKVKVLKSSVIFNGKNKPIISDHYGVELDIVI